MKTKIVFAGGGTGGHIYPGLAIADELRKIASAQNQEIEIFWFGNNQGMDRKIVEQSGSVDKFTGIPSGKLRRYFSLKNFTDVFKIILGFFCAFFKLLSIRPAVLFSKGGFVSVPPCIAARILGIPVITHECDFTPGLATRINSRFARTILVSYEETKKYLRKDLQNKVTVSGNPVRPVFYQADGIKGQDFVFGKDFKKDKPVLLVLGGSLGAHQINQLIVDNLEFLSKNFYIIHQCGQKDADFVPARNESYFPYPFIYSEMPDVIACADLIVSRAGANSIWECSVAGKPLLLIPLCGNSSRGDQVDNSLYFKERNAASVLVGPDVTDENFISELTSLLDETKRSKMAECSRKLSEGKKPALKIAELIFEQIGRK